MIEAMNTPFITTGGEDYNETEMREYITDALKAKGWQLHKNMRYEFKITDGQIHIGEDGEPRREKPRRADYLLFAPNGRPLAVVEAKRAGKLGSTGIQQAIEYARLIDAPFAFSSNGKEFEYYCMANAGQATLSMDSFPTQDELWQRYCYNQAYTPEQIEIVSKPYYNDADGREPRYYQRIVIDRVVEAYARGQKRMMFVMATGTGKTYTAFQILYRLLQSSVNSDMRILYLADRNILIDQTMVQDFKPFGKKMVKIEQRTASQSHEIFMSLYHQLVQYNLPEGAPQPYEQFNRDYFDIIMIDECHRGSARYDSEWRKILDYFSSATHIGMTATPKDDQDAGNSNIGYFGEPLYTYSLRQGIEDGFLAPYRITQAHINVDSDGYVLSEPEAEYFENKSKGDRLYKDDLPRHAGIEKHYDVAARRITQMLADIGPMTKTIVFCDEEIDAAEMRKALIRHNQQRQVENQNKYIMRITASDAEGKKEITNFISKNSPTPTVVTTSQLLSTGVDTKTVGLIVLYRNITSMTEFKQIIGRGTRIVEQRKYYFDILDFRGATELFFDPAFDGAPLSPTREGTGAGNKKKRPTTAKVYKPILSGSGQEILIDHEKKMVLDKDGRPITTSYIDYTATHFLNVFSSLDDFLRQWNGAERKQAIVDVIEQEGVDFAALRALYPEQYADRDIFDIILNIAFKQQMLSRRERARRVREKHLLDRYSGDARRVLEILIDTYATHGILAFENQEALKVSAIADIGTPLHIKKTLFGGTEQYKALIREIEEILYATA
ncbi:MAG: DEAD/DEAH box helicase family protein [Bacteroidales bacterium]|nr:DEAD/DEAH box helicase family protein [Candidatus Equimonas faecalis]